MRRRPPRTSSAASRATRPTARRGAAGALLFSCLGRGQGLFGQPDHDSRAFERALGPLPLAGFFCNGEIGPVEGKTFLHGYTSAFGIFRPERRNAMKATWKGNVLAESDDTVVVEGNHYFPAAALRREHFRESATHTVCPWKGTASYYDVVVGADVNRDAAWYYPTPKPAAANITGRVAFWKGV